MRVGSVCEPLTFAIESCRTVFDDAYRGGLLELHDAETREHLGYPVMPNAGYYWALEDQGILVTFSARDRGKLVGYATFLVQASHHTAPVPHAFHDSIFVHPGYRSGGRSLEFMRYCDAQLVADGVHSIEWGVPARKGYDRIFSRLGYRKSQYVYVRRVKSE